MRSLTPKRIVEELDKYIVGQDEAKKAVAIAIRNRWRRQQLSEGIREDVLPKNIIMIGPTGVGKTEIARRLAQLVNAPFIKVEASKYTEVGYHGRNVETIVRDLVEVGISQTRTIMMADVEQQAVKRVNKKLLDMLCKDGRNRFEAEQALEKGLLDKETVELEVSQKAGGAFGQMFSPEGMEQIGVDMQQMFDRFMPKKQVQKRMTVAQARQNMLADEADKLIDEEKLISEALMQVQNAGIIFIDEIDKIAAAGKTHGPDVSREGVQRDLLPIVEGSTVNTRHGLVKTDHILFIAAGAFHISKVADLVPELQGRFPIRVELSELNEEALGRIMTEPRNSLTRQYVLLLETEGVEVVFKQEGIDELARVAAEINKSGQNIGARRLYTIFEKLLEDPLYEAPETNDKHILVDKAFVQMKLKNIVEDEDLRQYVL